MEQFIIQGRREGFLLAADHFQLPTDATGLDPKTKRELTICNLFVNHNMPLIDIGRVLDESMKNVILALLQHEIIRDGRARPREVSNKKRIEKSFTLEDKLVKARDREGDAKHRRASCHRRASNPGQSRQRCF